MPKHQKHYGPRNIDKRFVVNKAYNLYLGYYLCTGTCKDIAIDFQAISDISCA